MGTTIQKEEGNLRVLRVTGLIKKSELDAIQAAEVKQWTSETRIKLLVILEDFQGWERGADWGDVTFLVTHGDRIEKIAIVGDPKQEVDFLAFAGAGLRLAPVKFFPSDQLAQARAWLG